MMKKELEHTLSSLISSQKDNIFSFDVVVSNPPYQKDTGNGAVAVYHHIMKIAKLVSVNISMIYPARWIIGGRGEGIEEFRNEELRSYNYKTFIIYSGESAVFKENNIKGGINYFHWTKKHNQTTRYMYNNNEEIRTTLKNNNPIMILNPRFSKIATKVSPKNHVEVKPRNYYGMHLETDYNIEKLAETFKQNSMVDNEYNATNATRIYYSGKSGGVRTAIIPKNSGKHSDDGYKLMVSRTADPDRKNHKTLRRQNRLFLLKPGEISGGSFLQVGLYETEQEALNALKYFRSSFAIFMFGLITPVPSTTRNNYRLIPNVDFSTGSIEDFKNTSEKGCLDFSETEETLDSQLFKLYDIKVDEQNLIKECVKTWSDETPDFAWDIAKLNKRL